MSRVRDALDRMLRTAGRVADQRAVYPLEAPTFGPGCCAGELDELQQAFHAALPPDYLEFLSLCRRIVASDVFNGYYLYSPFGLSRADSSIPRRLHVGTEPRLQEVPVVAIGGDGGGNQFLLGFGEVSSGHVWKWNHEHPVRSSGVVRQGVTEIAGSFSEFLERVADDWEHFEQNDRSWVYLSG